MRRDEGLCAGRRAYAQGGGLMRREEGLCAGRRAYAQGGGLMRREEGLYTGHHGHHDIYNSFELYMHLDREWGSCCLLPKRYYHQMKITISLTK